MSLRFEDLTPEQKRQVNTQLGAKPKRVRSQMRGSSTGSCHACGWRGSYAAWERTHATSGHARFEIDLGDAS